MHTQISLYPRSSRSFDTNDVAGLAAWLAQRGYQPERIRNSATEFGRMRGARDTLITIYKSGAVVLSGSAVGVNLAQHLLEPLILTDHLSILLNPTQLF